MSTTSLESEAMNWRRGISRTWAVAAVAWMVGVTWYQYDFEKALQQSLLPGMREPIFHLQQASFWIEWVVAPPVCAGLLVLALIWIFRGFLHAGRFGH